MDAKMPSDRELMRAAGDPEALQVAWCTLRPEAKLLEREEARRSVRQTLVDHINRKMQIVEDEQRLQADVVAMTRDEFAQCLRKVWAAAALQGAMEAEEQDEESVLARIDAAVRSAVERL